MKSSQYIEIRGAREHNLRNINIDIPRGKLVAFTGVSGSGKTSLAFDTIYAEGYRKYMESLSPDARRFLSIIDKPNVDYIRGLPPVIAVEQNTSRVNNPRSTLATVSEISDYARILWSIAGQQYCLVCGGEIKNRTIDQSVDEIKNLGSDAKIWLLSPLGVIKKNNADDVLANLKRKGWNKIRINSIFYELDDSNLENITKKDFSLDIVIDRFKTNDIPRISDSLELAFREGKGNAIAYFETIEKKGDVFFNSGLSCTKCGKKYSDLSIKNFSHNHPDGACENCNGLGKVMSFDPKLSVPDETKSIKNGAIKPFRIGSKQMIIRRNSLLKQLAEQYPFDPKLPWENLTQEIKNFILYGDDKRKFLLKIKRGKKKPEETYFKGVLNDLNESYKTTSSDQLRMRLALFQISSVCPSCNGTRLNPRSRNVFLEKISYDNFLSMSVSDAFNFVNSLNLEKYSKISEAIIGLSDRLKFLNKVGLGYITLDREYSTLSGGESRRARLATQLGMELVGAAYILDEPSIGLHPIDNDRLLDAIKHLRDIGNSVLLVEHDLDAIKSSDYIVELGIGAGEHGGDIIFKGTLQECLNSNTSLTGKYISGKTKIQKSVNTLSPSKNFLTIKNASENNLKKIDVSFPIGLFTTVCGVSGSGKSTLVNDILAKYALHKLNGTKDVCGKHGGILGLEYFQKCIVVDQSPIGTTPRSNPATYTKLFDKLRDLFAKTQDAKIKGYSPSRFSFNLKGGRCEHCQGEGFIKLDMQFLGEVFTKCPSCDGKRYNRETLDVRYKGKNISDVLNMSVHESIDFFRAHADILQKLETLNEVGLGYMKLGQASNTLSGGEAQRIKLSLELSKKQSGRNLYILDEPSTGLHSEDVSKLLNLLFKLRDAGNTIIVVEHNPDFIRLADYIIELGYEGGENGGNIIFNGNLKEMLKIQSPTSKFLY